MLRTLVAIRSFGAAPGAVVVAAALSLLSSACTRGIFADPSGYDAQACAEHALRGEVDHDTALQATAVFREACESGDSGACSGLGIIYERGLGDVTRDRRKAASLYRRSCANGNTRGCDNLRALVPDGRTVARAADR